MILRNEISNSEDLVCIKLFFFEFDCLKELSVSEFLAFKLLNPF